MMEKLHIAQYLVNTFGTGKGGITPLKVQKLLYYLKAWGLVSGHNLVPGGVFRKWPYGPVDPEVYHVFKQYGRNPIPYQGTGHVPHGDTKELIDFIGTCYAQFDAVTLSAMTHKETPWKSTPDGEVISEAIMRAYYETRQFAKNFPFDRTGKPFYPVESDVSYAFTMDMPKAAAKEVTTYPSFAAYLDQIQRASGKFDEWFQSGLVV